MIKPNREFYEVTEVNGKFMVIRQIARKLASCQAGAHPSKGTSRQPLRKLVRWGDRVQASASVRTRLGKLHVITSEHGATV
jgi:hypothetical protein